MLTKQYLFKILSLFCLYFSVQINKECEIEVVSLQPLPTYTYQIVARSKILESKTVVLKDSPATENRITFTPTFDHTPKTTVIVYYVSGESILSTSLHIDLTEQFKNFIDVEVVPDTAKPGDEVQINVKSNPKSYIGLLAIDQSVLLLRSGNDLANDEIWNELEMLTAQTKPRSYDFAGAKKKKSIAYYSNCWEDFSVSIENLDLVSNE